MKIFIWSARQVSILLTIIAIVLWIYSLLIGQPASNFGLNGVPALPVSLYISLALFTIASAFLWLSPQNHGKLLFLQFLFFGAGLWLIPWLINAEMAMGDIWNYSFWRHIECLSYYGHFDQELTVAHNWPAFSIMWSTITNMLGISKPHVIIIPISFLIHLALFIPLYLFLKNTINWRNSHWAGIWIFCLADWIMQTGLTMQALGFLLFLWLLALFSKTWVKGNVEEVGHRACNILFFACLTISHLLSSAFALFTIAILYFTKRLKGVNFLILAAVFIGMWTVYGLTRYFELNLVIFLREAFRLDLFFQGVFESVQGPGCGEALVFLIRVKLLTSAIIVIIAVIGFLFAFREKRRLFVDKTILAIEGACIFTVVVMAFYGGTHVQMGSWEMLERFYIFSIPCMAYFGVRLLQRSRKMVFVLCALLLLLLPCWSVSRYGPYDYMGASQSDIASFYFFQDYTEPGIIVACNHYLTGKYREGPIYLDYQSGKVFETLLLKDNKLTYTDTPLGRQLNSIKGLPTFIGIADTDRLYEYYYITDWSCEEIQDCLNRATNCNLIYANGNLNLYVKPPK